MKLELTGIATLAALFFMQPAASVEMPPLAKKLGCTACHDIDKRKAAPSWKEIAERYTGHGVKKFKYEGKEYPLIEGLVKKVSDGGSGNWGLSPMPPNDPLGKHKAEITQLIKFQQGLAKQKK
jgi:cytochrome c551/c552